MRVLHVLLLSVLLTGCSISTVGESGGDSIGTSMWMNMLFTNGYLVANTVLGILAAILIYRDASQLPHLILGTKPWWWAVAAVFLGPVWVVLVYWLIHHSTISNRLAEAGEDSA